MLLQAVAPPGPLTLVPGRSLDGQLRRQAHDYPGLPGDLGQLLTELNARTDGIAATIRPARAEGGDPSLQLYAPSYLVQLFPTRRGDAYTLGSISPLRLYDYHRLTQGYLLLRPAGWRMAPEAGPLPAGSDAHWSAVAAAWQRLTEQIANRAAPAAANTAFPDTLDRLIDATERITADAAAATPPFPYREVRAPGAPRTYEFQVTGDRMPGHGTFVRVRGERGRVTAVTGGWATVRFDLPVDWKSLPPQGELAVTPDDAVFARQRDAVEPLRTGAAAGSPLSLLAGGQVRAIPPIPDEPAEHLDSDQLNAFRKALAVPDLLLVLGPPGTGKTRTIGQLVRANARGRGRVLLTARTEQAVDDIVSRLPREQVAVRIGTEGKVTAEGEPRLLERRAAELREGILKTTERSLAAFEDIEVTAGWARELETRTDTLLQLVAEEGRARAELLAARRAAGGAVQARLDELAARSRQNEQALGLSLARVERLTQRCQAARTNAERPGLGPVYRMVAQLEDRRLAAERRNGERLHSSGVRIRAELDAATRELEAVTRDAPAVRVVHDAIIEIVRRRDEARIGALKAARAVHTAVNGMDTPPPVAEGADLSATARDLTALRDWVRQRMPLLAARAKLLTDWRAEVSGPSRRLHPELIRYADVVATTATDAASRPELSEVDFDLSVVDEAGQLGLTEVLVPLTRARRGVLVGDPQQLPPLPEAESAAWGPHAEDPELRRLLAKSAFTLFAEALPASHLVRLTRQRRMPAVIADFVSAAFYDLKLRTDVVRSHRDPLFGSPLAFIDTAELPPAKRYEQDAGDRERFRQRGFTNLAEAKVLAELAAFYHRRRAEWALLVPYRAQVDRIGAILTRLTGDPAAVRSNVDTVDSFSGGERDVILYGFTRANAEGAVGFLGELRRVNAAITRARHQLVLAGDLSTLTGADDEGFRALAKSLRDYVAERGELRGYVEIRDRLAESGAEMDHV
ncbi:DEAD/DEAH box helicase [Amycolatopsis anabasis]|uniref:DEAD/DEAH box helicase n=1 Tax=Amycolatopsis anabasis TaxID=1840409 RepID=UPI00131C1B95|nr:AAA domain-containing protein [Amycolatopsis anabasis]